MTLASVMKELKFTWRLSITIIRSNSILNMGFPVHFFVNCGHEIVYIYHFKCISYCRHFGLKLHSFNMRERERWRSPMIENLRAPGKIIWIKITSLKTKLKNRKTLYSSHKTMEICLPLWQHWAMAVSSLIFS